MLDGLSLDQLRLFVTATELGSFSAVGRKFGRAQSVVSQHIAGLEKLLGVSLFERNGRTPKLTAQGENLLGVARSILRSVDDLKGQARMLEEGLEPELSVVVDVMFPQAVLTEALKAFAVKFPHTALRLHVEAMGAVPELVLKGRCQLGVMGSLPSIPKGLESVPLVSVPLVTVVGPDSVLARLKGPISQSQLTGQVQLVLTDRSDLTEGLDFGVIGTSVWRLADLGAKHAFLKAGLGWGNMPLEMVADDLIAGTLVKIDVGFPDMPTIAMHAIYRRDLAPGPAGRWLISKLQRTDDI